MTSTTWETWPELPDGAPPPDRGPGWPTWMGFIAVPAALIVAMIGGLAVYLVGAAFGSDIDDPGPGVNLGATFLQDIVFVATALALAGLTVSAIVRIGRMRARRAMRRKRRAMWDSAKTKRRSPQPMFHDEDAALRRTAGVHNPRVPQERTTRVPRERPRVPQERPRAPQEQRPVHPDRERELQVTEMLSRLARSAQAIGTGLRQPFQRRGVADRQPHAIGHEAAPVGVVGTGAAHRVEQLAVHPRRHDFARVLVLEAHQTAQATAVAQALPLDRRHRLQGLGAPERLRFRARGRGGRGHEIGNSLRRRGTGGRAVPHGGTPWAGSGEKSG